MEIRILETYESLSRAAAKEVKHTLDSKPNAVLGLATGSTPLGLYQELVRMHREEGLDFSQVTTFNLDEYVGLGREDEQSYHYFMHENLFRHINIAPQNIYIPSGTTDNYEAFCSWYEQRIVDCGGIDLQILGIGSDGHIAFNEPTSSLRVPHADQDACQSRRSKTTRASLIAPKTCPSTPSRWVWGRSSKLARSFCWHPERTKPTRR